MGLDPPRDLSGIPHDNVLYVGKHGDDVNDGKNPDRAFLTFGAANTAASGETPTTSNRFVIVCQDAGRYDEQVSMVQYVSIYAPSAAIIKSVILADDAILVVDCVEVTGGATNALVKTGTGVSYVRARKLQSDGSGGSAHCVWILQGTLYLEADLVTTLLSGNGIKGQGTGATVIFLNVKKIKVENGEGFSADTANVKYRGRVNEIEITGTGDGLLNSAGDVHVAIGRLFDSGSGIGMSCQGGSGTTTVHVGEVNCDIAYSVAAGSALYLIAGKIIGTPSLSASAFIRVTVARRDNLTATSDPTVNDDVDRGYTVGSRWFNATAKEWWVCDDATANTAVWKRITGQREALNFIIDGGGAVITTGIKGNFRIPFAGVIQKVSLLADQVGDIQLDLWKDTWANAPPTVADTIVAAAPPTLTSAQKSEDSTLTGWTKTVAAGDVIVVDVYFAASIERVTLLIEVSRN